MVMSPPTHTARVMNPHPTARVMNPPKHTAGVMNLPIARVMTIPPNTQLR